MSVVLSQVTGDCINPWVSFLWNTQKEHLRGPHDLFLNSPQKNDLERDFFQWYSYLKAKRLCNKMLTNGALCPITA